MRDDHSTAPCDGPSFEAFYRREYQAVVGLAYVLSGSRWAAEDIAQDSFLAAHRSWQRISTYERPEAWVRRVVANKAASTVRRRTVEMRAVLTLANRAQRTLRPMEGETADFWKAVRSLPRRQGQVIALHYLEDLPVAAIADILGLAEGTVKAHLHKGRKALARRLKLDEPQEGREG